MYKGKQETDEDYGLGPDKSLSVPEFPTDLDNFASSHLKVKRRHFFLYIFSSICHYFCQEPKEGCSKQKDKNCYDFFAETPKELKLDKGSFDDSNGFSAILSKELSIFSKTKMLNTVDKTDLDFFED